MYPSNVFLLVKTSCSYQVLAFSANCIRESKYINGIGYSYNQILVAGYSWHYTPQRCLIAHRATNNGISPIYSSTGQNGVATEVYSLQRIAPILAV